MFAAIDSLLTGLSQRWPCDSGIHPQDRLHLISPTQDIGIMHVCGDVQYAWHGSIGHLWKDIGSANRVTGKL